MNDKKEIILLYGMISVDKNSIYLSNYKTEDDKEWLHIFYTNHEKVNDLKNADQIISDIKRYEKYSIFNWNREYITNLQKKFPDFLLSDDLTHFEFCTLSANLIELNEYEKRFTSQTINLINKKLNSVPHKEKPYKLYIEGVDDYSLTLVIDPTSLKFKNIYILLDDLKYRDLIYDDIRDFTFTN